MRRQFCVRREDSILDNRLQTIGDGNWRCEDQVRAGWPIGQLGWKLLIDRLNQTADMIDASRRVLVCRVARKIETQFRIAFWFLEIHKSCFHVPV